MAQIRIVVLSDIHVMGPGLIVNDGKAWQTALASSRKMLDYSQPIFDQLVNGLITEKPDLVLIPGDLTKDGEMLSHKYVKSRLEELVATDVKVCIIPGNHDLGTPNAFFFDGDSKTVAEIVNEEQFKTLYASCGYGEDSQVYGLNYAAEPIDGLVVLGIDSHRGTVSTDDLEWVCNQARQALIKGKQVLTMMHHPLIPHVNGADLYVNSATINDYETVRDRLADAGVKVILTGHFHTSDIARDWNADLSRDIYDINTGSTISYPCDYRILTLNKDMTQLKVDTKNVTYLKGIHDFTTVAEQRLKTAMTAVAETVIGNDVMSQLAAEAFIVHAKGDEHLSPDAKSFIELFNTAKLMLSTNAKIKTKLAARGLTLEDLEKIIKSVMTDTSHYGDINRANQTDDRTLTIDMTRGLKDK